MVVVDGDKSIAHRAVLLSLLVEGDVTLAGVPTSFDVRSSIDAVKALGVDVDASDDGRLVLRREAPCRDGVVVDCGNAGTLARLLCGVLAGLGHAATLTGDASLSRRPMRRVARPLAALLGDDVVQLSATGTLPARLAGGRRSLACDTLTLDVPSAQVKSAVLLCALSLGDIVVVEPRPTRDHTERLLASLGVDVDSDGCRVRLRRPRRLPGFSLSLPGDPSSAAFLLGRAAALPGACAAVDDVLLSPRRDGFLRVLARAGVAVTTTSAGLRGGEQVGCVRVRGARLVGVDVAASEIPDLVDEVPLLAALLTTATGPSRLRGLGELRVKESDRLARTATLLRAFGADVSVDGDDLVIAGGLAGGGGRVDVVVDGDHRLEMTARVLGRVLDRDVHSDGAGCEAVSFPRFAALLDDVERTL
jgi:3-phosphoshikimate 1-carboxyvinyltransferase